MLTLKTLLACAVSIHLIHTKSTCAHGICSNFSPSIQKNFNFLLFIMVDTLGSRLECEGTEKRCLQACLCYICSGNIEKLVECWALYRDCSSPLGLEV